MYNYDYFYGAEADQFSFFRIPKAFFKEERFEKLSHSAKILYGMMLDRMDLSRKNGWLDDLNRVYIIFSTEQVCEEMSCSDRTAIKILQQLEEHGLITRKRRGQGKPSLIYVMNYCRGEDVPIDPPKPKKSEDEPEYSSWDYSFDPASLYDEWFRPRNVKNAVQESEPKQAFFEKRKIYDSKNVKNSGQNPRSEKFTIQNVKNVRRNQTDMNQTDINNMNLSINHSINNNINNNATEDGLMDRMDGETHTRIITEDDVKAQIDYDCLTQEYSQDSLDEIVMIMTDVLNATAPIKIKQQLVPAEIAKSRFLKLGTKHISYVLQCISRVKERVTNIYNYMVTALYMAPATLVLQGEASLAASQHSAAGPVSSPPRTRNRFNNFEQREIDFDEVEALVFARPQYA